MNTTMAPMRDQPEEYMNRLVQRNIMLDDLQLAKRDGRGNDNGNGNGRNGERDDDHSNERSDDRPDKQVDGSQMPTPVVTRTAWTQVTNTAWTTQTATAWTTQTAITTSSSVMTVVVVATPSSTSTSASSKSTPVSWDKNFVWADVLTIDRYPLRLQHLHRQQGLSHSAYQAQSNLAGKGYVPSPMELHVKVPRLPHLLSLPMRPSVQALRRLLKQMKMGHLLPTYHLNFAMEMMAILVLWRRSF